MEKEKQKKDQFVIANLPDLDHTEAVIAYASNLAHRLNKGLILLHIIDPQYHGPDADESETRLQELQNATALNPQVSSVSYITLKGNTRDLIESIPTLLNGVVAVTASDLHADRRSPLHPKQILKDFSRSKIAYLVVRCDLVPKVFSQVALTIDFHRESKEKLIWSSYFARFGGSQLHVLYHDYKDSGLRQKWYNNMRFLHKFFSNLGITFIPHIVSGKASNVDADALPFIDQAQYDLLVAVTTKEKDLFDSLLGTQEQRTIRNPQGIPVLFLNPRDDIYVLCD